MQKQSRQVWLFPAPTVHPLHDADIADRNKYRCDLQLIDIFFPVTALEVCSINMYMQVFLDFTHIARKSGL